MRENGVLDDSLRFYFEADDFTRENLFWIPHAGIYHCDLEYEVEREQPLHVCQIIVIDSGELLVDYRGQTITASAGMLVLLDCNESHRYYAATNSLKMRWFHFLGNAATAYTEALTGMHGCVIRGAQNAEIEEICNRIFMAAQSGNPNGHSLSVVLHKLLALLAVTTKREQSDLERRIEAVAAYIDTHYAEDLDVSSLSKMAALSSCYLMRKFKEYQKTTLHQYVQAVRLRNAKEQLTTTACSIEEISDNCGFCNASHFIMTFRKNTNMTPMQFRTLWR